MRRVAAALIATGLLAAAPGLAQTARQIVRSGAFGCQDKAELVNLLFLGVSAAFDNQLATAIADGTCIIFTVGESVVALDQDAHGILQVRRAGAVPVAYWTPARNVN